MSNKSGVAGQVLSLPSGGGAISGIGETFTADAFTGTGNVAVPIAVPPGRNGLQPDLTLRYSTSSGNGPFGLGWSLDVPVVTRLTAKGVPTYDDTSDRFLLAGFEQLVPVEVEPGRTHYRPRTEGAFGRITHEQGPGVDHWGVRSTDGLVSRFGEPADPGADPAVVADPARPARIYAWHLSRISDTFGNTVRYEYLRDTGEEGPHTWDQRYLERVAYAEYDDPQLGERFLVSVEFHYADRPDPFSSHRSGFEIRTTKRCERIVVRTHATADVVVRSYELTYLDQLVTRGDLPATALPANGASLLSRVRVVGHDGEEAQELPPLRFDYTGFDPVRQRYQALTAVNGAIPARSLADPYHELVDLTGDGLPDVVRMDGGVMRVWRNLGGGVLDLPRTVEQAPAAVSLSDPGVQMADLDGDGRVELLVTDGVRGGYFETDGEGWARTRFVRYDAVPNLDLDAPDVRLVDVDGDGVVDVISTGARMELYLNDAGRGWGTVELREPGDPEEFPRVQFTDPRVKLADLTGDGLQDIALIHDGRVEYWPALGHGRWGRRVTMANSPRFENAALFGGVGFDPARLQLGDVDGDGVDDLVHVGPGHITVWINQGGERWGDPIVVGGTPSSVDADAVRLADMLGTGTAGVLWTYDHHAHRDSTYKFLDLTGGGKPYLLSEIDNAMGARTRVAYASSTQFAVADSQHPDTRWRTSLPFPVQVVARVEVIDELSGGRLTTEYRYHHGYWDGVEREFHGFGRVDQRDTETFEAYHASSTPMAAVPHELFAPPTETCTWFHLGAVQPDAGDWTAADLAHEYWPGDPQHLPLPDELTALLREAGVPASVKRDAVRALRGRVLRTEAYARDGSDRKDRPVTVTEQVHSLRREASSILAADGQPEAVFFPFVTARRITEWDRGDDPMARFEFSDDYDAVGQPRRTTSIACPRGWRNLEDTAGEPFLATRTVRVAASPVDPARHIVDRTAVTSTFEITNDGILGVPQLHALADDDPALRLHGQELRFYDGQAFTGRPLGEVGDHGVLVRVEELLLTEEVLANAYRSGSEPDVPAYLAADGDGTLGPEYPRGFMDRLPPLAGYRFDPGEGPVARGYWAVTEARAYDFQAPGAGAARGLLRATRDPLGNTTTVDAHAFDLLPVGVTDPVGLTARAAYDERLLQPREVEDANGNRTRVAYTPLGLVAAVWTLGREGENVGDTDDAPGVTYTYDFLAFTTSPPSARQPTSTRTITREHSATDTGVPLPERDRTIETVDYSDGFGRVLQVRAQAEDVVFGDPTFGSGVLPEDQSETPAESVGQVLEANVVVSGAQVYDNKGRTVVQFEPFYDRGFRYQPPQPQGEKVTIFHDALGRAVRTLNPDGSEHRVVFGVPGSRAAPDLRDPDVFEPTPWEAFTYDVNDNAGRTHPGDPVVDPGHVDTPASITVDALGRAIETVQRNGPDPQTDSFLTRSVYDIAGNLLSLTDALGREAVRLIYDLAGNPLRNETLDAKVQRTVLDAGGHEIERRDSRGALVLQATDPLLRATHLWARDDATGPVTLREVRRYGDGSRADQPPDERGAARAANRLGALHRHHDEAGLVTVERYDATGNALEKVRRVLRDDVALPGPGPPVPVDWEPPAGVSLDDHTGALLDPRPYRTSVAYDALHRIRVLRHPEDANGRRAELRPVHNRAGAVERITLDGDAIVDHLAYNARGQRTLIAFGNGILTRYVYEPGTFRLARLRSEPATPTGGATPGFTGAGPAMLDQGYEHDLAGNVTIIRHRSAGVGIPGTPLGSDALDQQFTYDPLYRLRSATGRECDLPAERPPWDPRPRCADLTRTRAYRQRYDYDANGNLSRLRHTAGPGTFTRRLRLEPRSNRLATVTTGAAGTTAYEHDDGGNVLAETASRHFVWDHGGQLAAFRIQAGDAEPSMAARYLYDADGQRVRKIVRRQGGATETTTYVDGVFEHHRWTTPAGRGENTRLLVRDDTNLVAVLRAGPAHPDDRLPAVQYHLSDHLGSSTVVVDGDGGFVNREEYTPYGETSFGSVALKRYRHTGSERDEESGLSSHGLRYYAPWLCRWTSPDPVVLAEGANPYWYARDNPLLFVDPHGTQSETPSASFESRLASLQARMLRGIRRGQDPGKLFTHLRAVMGDQFSADEWAFLDSLSVFEVVTGAFYSYAERVSLLPRVAGRTGRVGARHFLLRSGEVAPQRYWDQNQLMVTEHGQRTRRQLNAIYTSIYLARGKAIGQDPMAASAAVAAMAGGASIDTAMSVGEAAAVAGAVFGMRRGRGRGGLGRAHTKTPFADLSSREQAAINVYYDTLSRFRRDPQKFSYAGTEFDLALGGRGNRPGPDQTLYGPPGKVGPVFKEVKTSIKGASAGRLEAASRQSQKHAFAQQAEDGLVRLRIVDFYDMKNKVRIRTH